MLKEIEILLPTGFIDGINGPDLMENFKKQAERFGAEIINENVTSVDFSNRPLQVFLNKKLFEAQTVIVATGASTKWLGLDNEQKFIGRGVSSCATCDGYFFKGKDLVLVGGGDSAMEEALFLTKFANKVTVVHRRGKLRASKIMQDRAFKNEKINFMWNTEVVDVLGNSVVNGIKLKNVKSNEITEQKVNGLFVAIGHVPNTEFLKNHIELDENGYVVCDGTRSSKEGVFVAGDVHDFRYRQAITAAGHGCEAAIDAEKYIEINGL